MSAWRENIERVREGHAKAMEALGADVHPYSGPAIRDWEAQHDAALAGLTAQMEELEAALRATGDVLFGTWDDDEARKQASRKAEALTRVALFPEDSA